MTRYVSGKKPKPKLKKYARNGHGSYRAWRRQANWRTNTGEHFEVTVRNIDDKDDN